MTAVECRHVYAMSSSCGTAKPIQHNTVAIYVQVIKGTTPVIGTEVTAIVTLGTQNFIVQLLDNGASKSRDALAFRNCIITEMIRCQRQRRVTMGWWFEKIWRFVL